MPSGPKKRKNAKKKKGNGANSNSAIDSQGDDALNMQDDKESGEVSPHTSGDHHNLQNPSTKGEEEEEIEQSEDNATVRSIVPESVPMLEIDSKEESTQKMVMDESNVIQIDWDMKPDDDSDNENAGIDYVESVKESRGVSGSSNSSGRNKSSDEKPHYVEKNGTVKESGEPKVDDPKPTVRDDFLELNQAGDGFPVINDLVVKEPKGDACGPRTVNSVKPVDLPGLPQVKDSVSNTEAYNSVAGTVPVDEREQVSEEGINVNELTAENAMSSNQFQSGLMENGQDEGSGISPVVMDMGSQLNEEKVDSTAEHTKDSVMSECSDSQNLVASAPRSVRTTSWMSCCGLFEVFTGGSNR
ncbi:hypothetical protein RHSIM_Rhsim02G0193600 [Rhododendron simsii]|uniref:Uncharacterized protein n=1 Tax=Rhododendron simsii TaxID=118357 RepID=A0A834LT59_RHOSS|nr:hypothetical protein RHSIM_Rhsim02G0193600 [Rhododendron simsii]